MQHSGSLDFTNFSIQFDVCLATWFCPSHGQMTMPLLDLPPELLIHILSFVPKLHPDTGIETLNNVTIGHKYDLTPPICRVCHTVRREALPLYVKNSAFATYADYEVGHAVTAWLDALGSEGVRYVRSWQRSQVWRVERPERGQGHVGFYVKMVWVSERSGADGEAPSRTAKGTGEEWRCTTGTSPVVNDVRGMRLESVNLLRRVVEQRLRSRQLSRPSENDLGGQGLRREDVEFVVQAMEIVAKHPIEAMDLEQSEQGRMARRREWESMEQELERLSKEREDGGDVVPGSGGTLVGEGGSRFYTPY